MLCGGEILIVLFVAKITDSFENRSILEKTAVEIRDYIGSLDYRRFKPPNKMLFLENADLPPRLHRKSSRVYSSLKKLEFILFQADDIFLLSWVTI